MQNVSVQEAAKVAGVSDNAVRKWIKKGKVPKAEHEGQVGIPLAALTAFLEERPPSKGGRPPKEKAAANGASNGAAEPAAKAPKPAKADAPTSRFLTITEAAKLAGVSQGNIYFWIKDERIASKKEGAARLVNRASLAKYLEGYRKHKHGTAPARAAIAAKPRKGASAAPAAKADPGEVYSVTEAAALARVTRSTFYKWIGDGRFPSHKQGAARVVPRKTFDAFVATYVNHKAPKEDPQGKLPFSAVRALARGEERDAEFGGQVPRADHLAPLDMATQIGAELGLALSNYRKHVLREFFKTQLEKLDREG